MTPGQLSRPTAVAALALLVLLAGCVGAVAPTAGTAARTQTAGTADGTTTGTPTITVSAGASVSAAPDLAVVSLTVEATADSADAARERVAVDVERMRAALREAGVPDDAVTTAYYDIHARYDYGSERERELVGYAAVHAFRVEVSPERAGGVVDVAVGNGADRITGVSFTLADDTRDALRTEALAVAVGNARADAGTIADTAGVSLGGLRSASTSDAVVIPYAARAEDAGAGGSTSFEPGPVEVRASVTVSYDVAA